MLAGMQRSLARLKVCKAVQCTGELGLALRERDCRLRHLVLTGRDSGNPLLDVGEPLLRCTHLGHAPVELCLRLPDRGLAPLELAQLREAGLELRLLARQLALRLPHRALALGERSRLGTEIGSCLGARGIDAPELLELRLDRPLALRETRLAV